MAWTKEDEKALLSYKRIIDSDDIRVKEFVKKKLINNRFILHLLNNEKLEDESPDDYIGVNILPYYMIEPTQIDVKNYICVDVSYEQVSRYQSDKTKKQLDIYFYILCSQGDDMYGDSGLARHDLLASLIIDEFNWENVLGGRLCLLSDVASCVGIFASRTLKFRVTTDNNIAKTISYGKYQIPTIVNKGDPYEQS